MTPPPKKPYRPAHASSHKRPTLPPSHPSAPSAKPTHWHDVADWYDQLVGDQGSEYHQQVILPGVLRMLDFSAPGAAPGASAPPSPRQILDLACGQGVLCRALAATGALVTGLDAAPALIAAARRRNELDRLPITYLVADATKLNPPPPPLAPASFDAITCILAIQNMTPLSPIWQACRELLRPGGRLILVLMHPCFRIPKHSDWHWDAAAGDKKGAEGGRQSRVVSQYLSSAPIPIQTHPGLAAHGRDAATTTHFHRPLQAYINTLGSAGLPIDHIEEWASHKKSQPGPRQKELDRARREIPLFLALRARRPPSPPSP